MRRAIEWWDRHQLALAIAAILGGAAIGLTAPAVAPALSSATNPVLALLLFATFLGVPIDGVGRALRDARFLGTVLLVNFVAVPLLVFGLSRLVADDRGLLLGVLLVLLTPCVDYVIVFTGLAGGARDRLLAATPLLMVLQLVLLPGFLWLFAGADALALLDPWPFLEAFLVIIVVPLAAAVLVQALARRYRTARALERGLAGAMTPLLMLTLAVVVGSQIAAVGAEAVAVARLVPLSLGFAAVMVGVGILAGRMARLDVPRTRAVVFSGVTRNSLVVLPLALALPASLAIAPLAVVTQTLVELVCLLVLVRLVPRLVPAGVAPLSRRS
ncbi:arsenic resistance protein [Agromyces sp. NPDC060279]|uniref:arsenic resistance protein n=1 Tax=Agromyces sp. NPDC060279 TaxID=3347092 RepID=UPI00365F4CCC